MVIKAAETLNWMHVKFSDGMREKETELWMAIADCPEEMRDQLEGNWRVELGSWMRRIGLLEEVSRFKHSVSPAECRVLPQFHCEMRIEGRGGEE